MRLNKKIFSILLTFGLSNSAIALVNFEYTKDQNCTEKRLDKPPGVISKIPVHDQDGLYLCSSIVMAQLVDAWRLIYKLPVISLTAPLTLGLQYASKNGFPKLKDLPILNMLNNSNNLDSCSYDLVSKAINSNEPNEFVGKLFDLYKKAQISSSQNEKEQIVNSILKSCTLNTNNSSDVELVIKSLNESNAINFANKLFEKLCDKNKTPLAFIPKPSILKSSSYPDQFNAMNAFRSHLNGLFDQNATQPIGISYCKSVLKNRSVKGVSLSGLLDDDTCKDNVHASLIVGRRLLSYNDGGKVKKICQYLVRNTQGSSCNGYEDDPDALPNKSGGEKPKTCESGQVWVDEDALLRNTAELFHLGDK